MRPKVDADMVRAQESIARACEAARRPRVRSTSFAGQAGVAGAAATRDGRADPEDPRAGGQRRRRWAKINEPYVKFLDDESWRVLFSRRTNEKSWHNAYACEIGRWDYDGRGQSVSGARPRTSTTSSSCPRPPASSSCCAPCRRPNRRRPRRRRAPPLLPSKIPSATFPSRSTTIASRDTAAIGPLPRLVRLTSARVVGARRAARFKQACSRDSTRTRRKSIDGERTHASRFVVIETAVGRTVSVSPRSRRPRARLLREPETQ